MSKEKYPPEIQACEDVWEAIKDLTPNEALATLQWAWDRTIHPPKINHEVKEKE